ncbi:MAG: hypothetical protein HN576_07160 [Bacteriovoracaceae bacterium]|jgi:hypothetical protein|nr:hypothetical protein [Bacteriovoracaceae bacterium]
MSKYTLGPVAFLEGTWESTDGEKITYNKTEPIENNNQWIYGLEYQVSGTYDEMGHYYYEPATRKMTKNITLLNSIYILAGATVKPTQREFALEAWKGASLFEIDIQPNDENEFIILNYRFYCKHNEDGTLSYTQDIEYKRKDNSEILYQKKENTLKKC